VPAYIVRGTLYFDWIGFIVLFIPSQSCGGYCTDVLVGCTVGVVLVDIWRVLEPVLKVCELFVAS